MGPGPIPLACSVRSCHQPLTRRGLAYACDRGHTFDLARSGYLNLLQPQDRRSKAPGDLATALHARARLLAAGVGEAILGGVVDRAAASLAPGGGGVVLDLGCGTGEALERIAAASDATGVGIDISVDAVDRAARRTPALTWIVGNADRRLPLLDTSVAVVLSINARRNPPECARVLAPGGRLIVAVPAPDDLVELRERIQGAGIERDRADAVIEEHGHAFALTARERLAERHRLDGPAQQDLLTGTYRGARRSQQRHPGLDRLEVTLAADVLTFTRR